MLTDGALRMLVLLHFHLMGLGAIQIAYLFVIYEIAGVITNLLAGWIASKFGLAFILYIGLLFQIGVILTLTNFSDVSTNIIYMIQLMLLQGVSGIAKDLVKTSAKSSIRLLSSDNTSTLFKWVTLLTGSKNAIKGFGFFVGATSLGLFSFKGVLFSLAFLLFLTLVFTFPRVMFSLPKGKNNIKFNDIFSRNESINILSLARIFLFGARDIWFVVAVPLYLYSIGSAFLFESRLSTFLFVGAFMALWVILYGFFQALAPLILKKYKKNYEHISVAAFKWGLYSVPIPLILSCLLYFNSNLNTAVIISVILGLFVFGFIFAINSSIHSYLILALSSKDKVAMDVGFYYSSNAVGRLIGTLLSGILYQIGGVSLCLFCTSIFLIFSYFSIKRLSQ